MVKEAIEKRSVGVARAGMNHEAGRLIHDNDRGIFIDHLELNERLRLESERFVELGRLEQFNFVAFGSLGADLRRYRAVELHGAVFNKLCQSRA